MYRNKGFIEIKFAAIAPYLPFIIFSLVFILGTFIGSVFVGKSEYLYSLSVEDFSNRISLDNENSFLIFLKESVISIFPLYLTAFLFGTSVVGCVFLPFVLFGFGLKFGCLSGYLYFTYKLEGIMYNALVMIPSTLVAVFGLILLCKEAFALSACLSNLCLKASKSVNLYSSFKTYCFKSLITLIAAIVSVVFDIGMSFLFADYFNF